MQSDIHSGIVNHPHEIRQMGDQLKVLQIFTFNEPYFDDFYKRNPHLLAAPFTQQLESLRFDAFGGFHVFAPYLCQMGYDAQVVIANCKPLQLAWARENNIHFNPDHWSQDIVRQQIETIRPDIVYCLNPLDFDTRFFLQVKHRPRLLVGWCATEIPIGTDWSVYDLMLSHLGVCRETATIIGAKQTDFFLPGVPAFIANAVESQPKEFDVVFRGQFSPQYSRRNEFLIRLARVAAREGFKLGLFLRSNHYPLPPELAHYNYGEVWGLNMLRVLRSARIVIDAELDQSGGEAANLRLFETTAVGSFLLTEHQSNTEKYFKVGEEIETFRDYTEMLDKVRIYLASAAKRQQIAKCGQARALAEFSIEGQASKLDQLFRKHLALKSGTQILVEPDLDLENSIQAHFVGSDRDQIPSEQTVLLSSVNQALDSFSAGDVVGALRIADRVLESGLVLPELNYLRLLCLNAVGRYEEALQAAEAELKLNPNHAKARAEHERLVIALARSIPTKIPISKRSYESKLSQSVIEKIDNALSRYTYRGVVMSMSPFDMALISLLMWELKPRTVFEIGSNKGGSGLWFGDVFCNFNIEGHCYSLDSIRPKGVSHERVTFTAGQVHQLPELFSSDWISRLPRPFLVVSRLHQPEQSRIVLDFFDKYLQSGEYMIVESGALADSHGQQDLIAQKLQVIKDFVRDHPEKYEMDEQYLDYFGYNFTLCTNGFLKKV